MDNSDGVQEDSYAVASDMASACTLTSMPIPKPVPTTPVPAPAPTPVPVPQATPIPTLKTTQTASELTVHFKIFCYETTSSLS